MSSDEQASGPAADVAIRDAACVVVVDFDRSPPRVLMGRRHADQIFLPNKWVFPGGRLDDDDRALAEKAAFLYAPSNLAAAIRPFALAGARELCEETGLIIGDMTPWPGIASSAWQPFAATGRVPAPHALTPLARAITPPGRVRRYDTWFFMARRRALADVSTKADGELLDLDWFDIEAARRLDLPAITRLVLDELAARVQQNMVFSGETVPFYYATDGVFRRDLIASTVTPCLP